MLKDFITDENYLKNGLLGTIFADGSIGKIRIVKGHTKPAYVSKAPFEVTHTLKNLDYLKQVKELLEMLPNTKCTLTPHNKKVNNNAQEFKKSMYLLYRLATNSTEFFAKIRDKIYTEIDGKRQKLFPKEFIYKFNDLSLLLLYLDDGNLRIRFNDYNRMKDARVTFCLNSFTLDELIVFEHFLKEMYNIDCHHYKFTKSNTIGANRGFMTWLNTTNTLKFMEIINKFYDSIPSMQYKFVKYYLL